MKYLKNICSDYKNVSDLIIKRINGVYVIYLESLVNQDKINEFILKDLANKKFIFKLTDNLSAPKLVSIDEYNKLKLLLESGFTIILTNFSSYAIETKGNLSRAVTTPQMEPTLYGPKDSLI